MKKLLLTLISMIFLVSIISATTYEQGSEIDLKYPCKNNGTYCAGTVECNITIYDPELYVLANNEIMTVSSRNSYYNYTLKPNITSKLGDYTVDLVCIDDGVAGSNTEYFTITPLGDELSTPESILYILFLAGAFFLFLLTLYGAVVIPFRNTRSNEGKVISVNDLKYVKIMLICFTYLLLLLISGMLQGVMLNYLPEIGVHRVFSFVYSILFAFVYPLIVCSLLFAFVLFLQDKKINKALIRGLPIR